MGIKTLATTIFTMEQAILAAEMGCTHISPFMNELKTVIDPSLVAPIEVVIDIGAMTAVRVLTYASRSSNTTSGMYIVPGSSQQL